MPVPGTGDGQAQNVPEDGAVQVAVVGAGRMGRGIAIAFAAVGSTVTLVDAKPRDAAGLATLRAAALAEIAADLAFLVDLGLIDPSGAGAALARVAFAGRDEARDALGSAAIVFEGVPETIAAKRDAFAFICAHAGPDCIIASTTSTIDPDELAPLITGPERFLNAHWLNPAYLMPLVELAPASGTAAPVVERLKQVLQAAGKVPIVCRNAPGYIVPRIQALAMNEAARIVEEGIASAEDVDLAVRTGFGLRFAVLGLLEFIDWGGGDILYHASHFLSDKIDAGRFAAPQVVARNMEGNRRGLRDGEGFYDYRGMDTDSYRAQRLGDFVALLRLRGLVPPFASGAAVT
ncbi:3-hydroxybutyryl-CoA dehydrogenase [Novosphingobium sp. YJ-S2-02]|uniref:L-gulonate 3-dehydrogenase n=1 Tax=Novosphingobium aureum TaxID=2792964 RepID=A0A931MJJ3_9SPHN|nr:3-hydroxybutyryl-CoA dehydrogenase [Novosphingobium aureum]MBH0111877.1 3-hydroxybutyryl-CoA dehydrogenase [Novosphingobium aureum]